MAVLMTPPYLQFFDNSTPGIPLNGGKIYTYAAGTSTPKATFTDYTEGVAAANPIVLDTQGRATVWVSGAYRFVIKDSLGNLIRDVDHVTAFSVADAAAAAYFQTFSGDGSTTVFTVSQDLGTDENALFIDVDAGAGKGYDPLNPNAYTINGTTLTFSVAPAVGVNNVFVRAPLTLLNAASAAAAAAATSETNAAASAVLASQWASLTSGIVATTDYSAKAWAIGGTGVTTTSGKGAAKEWATSTGAAVDTSEYSAKEYAVGTVVAVGSAKLWATKTNGLVQSVDGSAKAWAIGGTGITTTASAGAAKEWATTTGGAVDTSEYSAKEYAIGTTVAAGSAKAWADKTTAAVSTTFSAKEYAQGTQAATGGSAKNWSQQTGADVTGASANSRSAKSWAQDNNTGATLGGSAKDWAQSASLPDGTSKSSKSYAADAAASATAANSIATGFIDTSTTSLAIGTGTKTFTVTAGKLWQNGQFIIAASAADNTNYMHGTVTSYSGTTLATSITDIGGSGTKTDWNISLSGTQGTTGATGSPGSSGSVPIAAGAGTVDAITATPSGITLADMALCAIISSGANTITTPTFAPNSLTAHTVTARGGAALVAGDTGPVGYVMLLEYNLANTRWELLNPSKVISGDVISSLSLITPLLGTPTSGTLTNCTGYTDANVSFTDITTNNASTTKHGFLPKLDNTVTHFLNGQGGWTTPPATTLSLPRTTQTSTYAPTTTDNASEISFSGAGADATWTIAAGATNGSGWYAIFNNPTSFNLTIKVTTNTIDGIAGATGFVMYPGEVRLVQCNGTNYFTTIIHGFAINTTSTFTFVLPPGYAAIDVMLWGGGGSGGKGATNGGGGGGGGFCASAVLPVAGFGAVNSSTTITIGAGGTGQASANTAGNAGGTSSIGSLLNAYGGGRGGGSSLGAGGGGGGAGLLTGNTGTISWTSGVGGNATTTTAGTGGVSWNQTTGAVASTTSGDVNSGGGGGGTGSAGGNAYYGGGGGGPSIATTGGAGGCSVFGGGGGGGGSNATGGSAGTSLNGGSGSAGQSGSNSSSNGTAPAGGSGGVVTGTSGNGGSGQVIMIGVPNA